MASERRVNTVTFAPVVLFHGGVGLEYERALSEKVSLFVTPGLGWGEQEQCPTEWHAGEPWVCNQVWASSALIGAGLRYFISGTAPAGFWAAPMARLELVSRGGEAAETSNRVNFGLGGMLGYTFLIGEVMDLSLGAGLLRTWGGTMGYMSPFSNTHMLASSDGAGSVTYPQVRLSVGYAF